MSIKITQNDAATLVNTTIQCGFIENSNKIKKLSRKERNIIHEAVQSMSDAFTGTQAKTTDKTVQRAISHINSIARLKDNEIAPNKPSNIFTSTWKGLLNFLGLRISSQNIRAFCKTLTVAKNRPFGPFSVPVSSPSN